MPIGPTKEQIKQLVESELETPVVMLNLLKFAERADGANGAGSGRDSYARYGDRVRSMLESVGGRILWQGRADSGVVGGKKGGRDAGILGEGPSRKAAIRMAPRPTDCPAPTYPPP